MNPSRYEFIQKIQQPSEFLLKIDIAFAVSETLNAVYSRARRNMLDAQHFRPVRRIQYIRLAYAGGVPHGFYNLQKHGPACGGIRPAHVHVLGSGLGVCKQRSRKFGRQRGFPDPLRTVDHHLLRPMNDAACDIQTHRHNNFLLIFIILNLQFRFRESV